MSGRDLPKRISAVLLAAGTASRFGGVKQLATLGGVTLVERALATLAATAVDEVVVVLGNEAESVRARLGRDVRVVVNESFRDGLSSSLKAGIEALDEDVGAAVVVLTDQPLVTPWLIDSIIERYRESGSAVVTSSSGDLVSPPVLFDRSIFAEIEALTGDVGAKSIVMKHGDAERVEVEADLLLDVDRAEDIERARRLLGQRTGKRARVADARGRARPS